MNVRQIGLGLVACALALGGCRVGPQSTLGAEGVDASGLANTAHYDGDRWQTHLVGSTPTNTVIDADGLNKQTTGPQRDAAFLIPIVYPDKTVALDANGNPVYSRLFLSDPSNTTIKNLLVRGPGDGSPMELSFDEFGADNASVIAAFNEQVLAFAQENTEITKQQVDAVRAQVDAGVSVFDAIANVGVRLFAPAAGVIAAPGDGGDG